MGFTRNSNGGSFVGGVWNMVFVGVAGAPASHCGDTGSSPYTTVTKTPLVAEKPYITITSTGKFQLQIPVAKVDSSDIDFLSRTTTVPFENVYVTKLTDGSDEINDKLSAGLHVV